MEYRVPHYYKAFSCIAGACPDTCCAGWAIMIDDASKARYRHRKGAFGNRLANSINWEEGCFKRYDGRCAFLNEENLCDIYVEAGEESMCRTCRLFPRHIEEFEGVREISLSLSCPVAAELILGCEEPVRFLHQETEKEENYPFFDFFLYTKLTDARAVCIRILQNRNVPVSVRTAMVLALSHDLQRRIRNQTLYEAEALFELYEKPDAVNRFEKLLVPYKIGDLRRFSIIRPIFQILDSLEHLRDDWSGTLAGYEDILYADGEASYAKKRLAFQACINRKELKADWTRWKEQLMVYFLFTYYCGGVYDENPYGKAKLAVVSTLLIEELTFAEWILGDRFTDAFTFRQLFYRMAETYAREVEHSDPNLNTLDQAFCRRECQMKQLLMLVLS